MQNIEAEWRSLRLSLQSYRSAKPPMKARHSNQIAAGQESRQSYAITRMATVM